MTDLKDLIKNLPLEIKAWFSSEKIVYTIMELQTRLNISREKIRVIPDLIARLITRDIEPRDFVPQLSINLDVSESAAKIITKELEEKIFHPVEDLMRSAIGVDVALLHFKKDADSDTNRNGLKEVADELSKINQENHSGRSSNIEETERHIETSHPLTGANTSAPKTQTPFILHEEREEIKPITQAPRPTFSIRIPLKEKKYAPIVPPVTARIETGGEALKQESTKTQENMAPKFNIKLPPINKPAEQSGAGNIINKLPRPPLGPLSSKSRPNESVPNISATIIGTAGEPQIKKVVNYFWK